MDHRVTQRPTSVRSASAPDRLLGGLPSRAYDRITAARLCVLAYHGVDDPINFSRHLDWLISHRSLVSLDQVVAALYRQARLPRRATLITFDDGERSVLDSGLPLLVDRQLPAVAFVVAGLIGTDEPFWWNEVADLIASGGRSPTLGTSDTADAVRTLKGIADSSRRRIIEELRMTSSRPARRARQLDTFELRALDSNGVRVENHSLAHPCLDRCDEPTVDQEIDKAHEILTDALGREPRAFAYPNGNWDARAHRLLMTKGYRVAFMFDHRLATVPGRDPLTVSRVRVGSTTSIERLAMIVSGLHPRLHHLRGRA